MSKEYNILVINPGSTSTKVALYKNEKEIFSENVIHRPEELKAFPRMFDQYEYRLKGIRELLEEKNIPLEELDMIMARGGLPKPIKAGTYEINDDIISDQRDRCIERWGLEHASNLAAPIARDLAGKTGIKACIADPVTVDELIPLARITGIPEIEYKSTFHALNLRAVGRIVAKELGRNFEDVNLIGVHMGGGISITAFEKGKAIDTTRGGMGYGPFSPQRAGTLAIIDIMELCFSGKYTKKDLIKKFMKDSGLVAHLGTDDCREVEKRIEGGDKKARLIYEAMIYQICKSIGEMAVALSGKIDAIYLTGGMANSGMIENLIKEKVSFLGKIFVYPSENEMYALATAGLRVLRGEEKAIEY